MKRPVLSFFHIAMKNSQILKLFSNSRKPSCKVSKPKYFACRWNQLARHSPGRPPMNASRCTRVYKYGCGVVLCLSRQDPYPREKK